MLNSESRQQLEERKKLNSKPAYELEPLEARIQFNKSKSIFPPQNINIKSIEDRKISANDTEIGIRIFTDKEDTIQPLLVNFHGGGWVLGDLDADDSMCRKLAQLTGFKVISVDYRLAPENKFPMPLQDCYKSLIYFFENYKEFNIDPNNISICGTSAGGNLAAAVSMLCRETKKNIINSQILFCPVTNNNFETESYEEFSEGFGLERKTMQWFWDHYIDDKVNRYSAINLDSENNNLPKTFIAVAECDILKSEAIDYFNQIKENVETKLKIYDGALHGFNTDVGNISNADLCMKDVSEFLV